MTKINQILNEWQAGDIHTLSWFANRDVQQRTAYAYFTTGSLKKIGPGVFARSKDKLSWLGAIRAMQEELGLDIHVGAKSALELHGIGHQVQTAKRPLIDVIIDPKANVPIWIKKNQWSADLTFRRSNLITPPLQLVHFTDEGITISISSREQAILEFIYTLDLSNGFETAENYLFGLMTLRPHVMQEVLERCTSIKVKRVFLFLAEMMEMPFFNKLKIDKIDLGKGKRLIFKGGRLNSKYQITVPYSYTEEKSAF